MLKFNEFLAEGISEVKAAAWSGIKAGKYSYENTEESRFQFARDMAAEGFKGKQVSDAWKSAVVTGELFTASKASKTTAKPKPAKAEPKKDIGDKQAIKSILNKYDQIKKLLNEINSEGRKIETAFKAANKGVQIHNLDTPDLYKQSVAVANSHYVSDIIKTIDDRIWSIKTIK